MSYHIPSNHKINGVSGDLEVTLPVASELLSADITKDRYISFIFKKDDSSSSMFSFAEYITLGEAARASNPTFKSGSISVNLTQALINKLNEVGYYTYPGSLVIPDCKEGLTWFVAAEILPISTAEFDKLKAIPLST